MDILALFSRINWVAVILTTILSFVLGALWHSPKLFGKAWMEELNYSSIDKKVKPSILFGLSAVLHFMAVAALSTFIGQNGNLVTGLIKGFAVSIAWIVPAMGVTYLFASRSLRLFLIDAGFYVVFFSIAGLILGAF